MNLTFEEAIDNYLQYVKLKDKPQSHLKIKSRINNHILPFVKGKSIHDFKAVDYLEWQMQINEMSLKYSYRKTLHYCFVAFLNFCIKFYDLKENVASKVGNFKNIDIESEGKAWTLEEYKQFISCVDNNIYHALFNFLFFSGCRMGETLALTFNDIIDSTININKTITKEYYCGKRITTLPKTKKSIRIISIDSLLKKEIEQLREYYSTYYNDFNNNFYIFGGNKPLTPTTITRKKNQYCRIANVPQIKIHEFRHSHACLLFQNNVPIEDISKRLGHSSITMTMNVYLRNIPRNEKRVIDTLNSLRLAS